MPTDLRTLAELDDLLTTLLADAADGTNKAWSLEVGSVEKLPIATKVQSNWRVTPTGHASDKKTISQAVDIVRAQHPCV